MSQKRQKQDDACMYSSLEEKEQQSPYEARRKRPSFRNAVLEVMKFCTIHKYVEPVLEPLIRRVVREEVEVALERHIANLKWDCENETESILPRSLQLQFFSPLSLPVFTGTRIEGEDCSMLKVALINAKTGKTVSSGIESSSKVEIVVLEGDFGDDISDSWTLEEFNANIVKERRGKKPLLSGNVFLTLKEGVGDVGDLSFTDNSSWTRSRRFRLGARVLDSHDGVRVREAKSESFIVRDHRGELYKKHHPPYMSDEVWRLEKISKDGAFHKRLNKEKVKTVQDFLVLYFLDPSSLRNILGPGMSNKMWEVVVEHATKCVLDDNKLYLYYPQSDKKDGVVFNVVGQVLGLLTDCKYVVSDNLSEPEKTEARKLVISAFQHADKVLPYDDEASLRTQMTTVNPEGNKSLPKARFDCPINPASPDMSMGEYGLKNMGSSSVDVRFEQPDDFQCHVENTLICDPSSSMHLQYLGGSSCSHLHCAVDRFLFSCSAIGKAQRRWKIVSSVVKWLLLMLEIRKSDVSSSDQKLDKNTRL
ncbi:calmodulin binding protein-like protein [Artemisia annua]|uniref:Calmodulin binding protein-like protein n=1 Tax=Artemisia annua TaxID=35608 RepID=A0A2U1NAD0_ARTAN|nr:calmodulin binding protein-like protein [Artemisia annua]